MFKKHKALTVLFVLLCLNFNIQISSFAKEAIKPETRYPDYAYEFLGEDKYENFNRKIFNFNGGLNKYFLRPVHIVWASVMPKYGMDRLESTYKNIEYPKRLMSCLVQKDLKASGRETVRFLTNTTIGIGGLYDPAKKIFKIEPHQETMEQALAKCKVKQGPYLVVPGLASSTPRSLAGRLLECPLDAAMYLGSPVTALAKAGLLVNRTSYMQPLSQMIESTYADPYDIAKKLYGIESYIKNSNLDRKEVLDTNIKLYDMAALDTSENDEAVTGAAANAGNVVNIKNPEEIDNANIDGNMVLDKLAIVDVPGGARMKVGDIILTDTNPNNLSLYADMILHDYKPQCPVVDSMRTALFDLPGINDSIWTELSVWNRCFSKKIKTSSVSIDPNRENYKFRYILQKDKTAPVAIIYPSIGEGITSHHSVVLAKLFYDEGYSVVIQGSHFHWEFVKSMPQGFVPGIPANDADYLKIVTSKILSSLQTKYNCQFSEKLVIGTSFGALSTLFLADKESKNNTMNINKYISINPPIELVHALKEVDKNNDGWDKDPANLKHRVAITAAKIIQIYQLKDSPNAKIETLPFSEEEAKLITGFIMRQKLSDLIFTIENTSKSCKCGLYKDIHNISYRDYVEKYLIKDEYTEFEDLNFDTSLHSIAEYLKNNDNYKIYHTLDDYFVNRQQLKQLKEYSGNKIVILNNGGHLGFLYREEFIAELKKDISRNAQKIAAETP